jgi:deoxyhypusine synthase
MADAPVSGFLRHHFRHFNGAALIDAADGYKRTSRPAAA